MRSRALPLKGRFSARLDLQIVFCGLALTALFVSPIHCSTIVHCIVCPIETHKKHTSRCAACLSVHFAASAPRAAIVPNEQSGRRSLLVSVPFRGGLASRTKIGLAQRGRARASSPEHMLRRAAKGSAGRASSCRITSSPAERLYWIMFRHLLQQYRVRPSLASPLRDRPFEFEQVRAHCWPH